MVINVELSAYSIMVVDDHPIIHSAIEGLLASEEKISVDATAHSAAEAMEILAVSQPDLIILDLSLGDSDGTYLLQKIHSRYPKIRILVYTISEEMLLGERAARAGAMGYVMKTSAPEVLKEAIHAICNGQLFFSDEIKNRIRKKKAARPIPPLSALDYLSNREMDIFKLIGEGLNTLHISDRLSISKNTVDTHRINIRKKLELPNGKALDRMAYEVIIRGRLPQED
jgi:DNA-binding NarL/FixJ family response regulator